MEKQTLPNSVLILVLGILSVLTCCCWGFIGLILGIITLVLAKKAKEIYLENPELYSGYGNVKTGRILAIIGIILSALTLISWLIMLIFYGGMEGVEEMQREFLRGFEEGYSQD
ncbi:MAG TPA: CCC motif membrane protein [Salinimicrobium sp.]|nr:CCC motif membrane protein [Salinimicrobium sp.]